MIYNNDLLATATEESQMIEGEPLTGRSFDNHWRATLLCRTVAEVGQLLHPRVLHQVLAEGMPLPPNHAPGDYRSVRVYVNTHIGVHHFPLPDEVPLLMDMWWDKAQRALWLHDPDLRHESVRWALHAAYESIHPHPDLNGRTGRCLLWSMAMLANVSIDVVQYKHRSQYYERLQTWRQEHPDLTKW